MSARQLRIFNDGLWVYYGEVSVVWMGQGYIQVFLLRNGRFVFTATRLEHSPNVHVEKHRNVNKSQNVTVTAAILFYFSD